MCPSSSGQSFYYPEGAYVSLKNIGSNEIWTLSWSYSRMKKIKVNNSGTGYSNLLTKGSRSSAASSASATYFYYPWGISVDSTNNRIITTGLNKATVQSFDMNGDWEKNFGGAPQTRMQAAHEAIKAIVTDASLTSGVNFGFAYWAHGSLSLIHI